MHCASTESIAAAASAVSRAVGAADDVVPVLVVVSEARIS